MKLLTRQEELVLLTVYFLRDETTLKEVKRQIIKQTGKEWSISSVYVPLDRLTVSGYIKSYFGEPASVRGGKAQRYFKITEEGIKALNEIRSLTDMMWERIEGLEIGDNK